jgi:hypothetical protein
MLEGLMRKILLALIVVAACGEDQDTPQAQTPCEQLREHLIDLRLSTASDKVDKDAHREAMRTALGAEFLASCNKLPEQDISCAMAADDTTSAIACTSATSKTN